GQDGADEAELHGTLPVDNLCGQVTDRSPAGPGLGGTGCQPAGLVGWVGPVACIPPGHFRLHPRISATRATSSPRVSRGLGGMTGRAGGLPPRTSYHGPLRPPPERRVAPVDQVLGVERPQAGLGNFIVGLDRRVVPDRG